MSETPNAVSTYFETHFSKSDLAAIESIRQKWGWPEEDYYPRLQSWFLNFGKQDLQLALKMLRNVQYVSNKEFAQRIVGFKHQLIQYLSPIGATLSDVILVVPDERADSADRHAYDLIKSWGLENKQVVEASKLKAVMSAKSVLIFFNDTHGTGNQFLREVLPTIPKRKFKLAFLLAVTFAKKALQRFSRELPRKILIPDESVSTGADDIFTHSEFRRIKQLSKEVYPAHPLGYGDAGLVTFYEFQCPNNTLPLIWANGQNNAVNGKAKPWFPLREYLAKKEAAREPEPVEPPRRLDPELITKNCLAFPFSPKELAQIQAHIANWELVSEKFYKRAGTWFNNFTEEEKALALAVFLRTRYLNIKKTREQIKKMFEDIMTDILGAGGDLSDILIVTTGDEKNSVYHYLFEFIKEWGLEIDQICNIKALKPHTVIDKTLVLFYHTRPDGNFYFTPQGRGKSHAERIAELLPRAVYLAAYAIAPGAVKKFTRLYGRDHVLYHKEASEPISKLGPALLKQLAPIAADLLPGDKPRDHANELLVAYYFQCPDVSSPLLWMDRCGDKKRRPWKSLFQHIRIPA
jgi:hypothetical protein